MIIEFELIKQLLFHLIIHIFVFLSSIYTNFPITSEYYILYKLSDHYYDVLISFLISYICIFIYNIYEQVKQNKYKGLQFDDNKYI